MSLFHQDYQVQREDYANAGRVSSSIKSVLKQMGLNPNVLRNIAVACYEAEINMIIHSEGGEIELNIAEDGLLSIHFNDHRPGISDLEKAMSPGWSTASEKAREFGFGAGMGLPNIKRVSDEFEIETSPQGTRLMIGFRIQP